MEELGVRDDEIVRAAARLDEEYQHQVRGEEEGGGVSQKLVF